MKNLRAALGLSLIAAVSIGISAFPAYAMNIVSINTLGLGTYSSTASIKASQGQLVAATMNGNAGNGGPYYLDFFNVANPTLGTTKPVWEVATTASSSVFTFPAWLSLGGSAITAACVQTSEGSATCSTNVSVAVN